jgi:hypothetical protein
MFSCYFCSGDGELPGESAMTKASDECRQQALRLCERANVVHDFNLRVEYESLAFAYMCLAAQMDADCSEWSECLNLGAA